VANSRGRLAVTSNLSSHQWSAERKAMAKQPQLFDICIVCALPEEARAFLEVVQQQCTVAFEKRISAQYKYDYQSATIKNDKDGPLNLHVSWLPRYGPQEMILHLSHVLEECQPRIAIMTGICAGDAQRVQLGDLVVAERTFTYDNGKFTLDEHDRSVHEHDTMTYQLDANILQFLGLFDEWKPLVARLPLPSVEIELKWPEIRCHIKAMASGSAVRADNPFEDVRAPVRGTVAIDMEGAAFGLVMSRHPAIRWLIAKGICDYADTTKSDAYHDYAAHASALYALSFIRAYVTDERLPRPDGPYARNPYFMGRNELLDQLHQHLTSERYETHTEFQGWEYVTYENQRDLGAALAGRSLGPTDVEACPQLPEVTTVLQQLSVTSSAIIRGRSGCGKTITAFQAAYAMHKQGWGVLRLVEPHLSADKLISEISNLPQRTVLILDNAQALDQHLVRRLQERSAGSLAVIIISTEDIINPLDHDAISIVSSRAVDILAKAIQNRKKEILPIIQKLDPYIGEGFFDIPLERRIEEAVQCETPWQFNFVLTGGELRSRDILARVREVNRADLLLVTIAAGQIVTLDEEVPMSWLERAVSLLGRDKQWLEQSLRMLQKRRVIFGTTYYRCSHLRFAVHVLHVMCENTNDVEWSNVVAMLREVIAWETTPIRGISWLLHELRFVDTFAYQQKSNTIVTHFNWRQIVERCWKADSGEDRRDAAFVLAELIDWYPDHIQTISDSTSLLAQWIENADNNSGFALGLLVNSLSQEYRHVKHVTQILMEHIDPHVMAFKLSQLKWTGVMAWSFLVGRLRVASSQEWRTQFDRSVDFTFIETLIETMSIADIYAFNTFLENVGVSHTEKALNLIERAIPKLANAFHNDFIEAFKEFRDSIWFVLGYARGFLRRKRPSSSQHRVAKKFANALQPQIIAHAISHAAQRDWDSCADMLSFINEAAPKHAAQIANLINFSQLDETAQGIWERCPHELLQLILSLSILPNHEPARSWVMQHSDELKEMDSVLAIVTPQIIIEKLRTGHNVPLTLFNSELSLLALRSITAIDSSLAVRVFKHNILTIAKELSELQPYNCRGVTTLITYLHNLSPAVFTAMIKEINPAKAKKNWGQCLQSNTESKKVIAVIFTCSQLAEGPITEVISQLKMKYPSASAYSKVDIKSAG